MDINALKERLQGLNRRTDKPKDIWKPSDEHTVRLVPYPHGPDPLLEMHFHYEIGDTRSLACPKLNQGLECAVCDFADKLRSWKDENGNDKREADRKADFEVFKKIQAKAKVYVPVVERGKEADGPKFWGLTPNQSLSLLEICADGDRLSELGIDKDDAKRALNVLFSAEKAYDLKVSFRKPGEKGNTKTFTEVVITGTIKAGPLDKDKKRAKELCDAVKDIKDVFPMQTSAEVQKIMDRWLASPTAKSDEPAKEKYESKSKERADKVGGRSIDEAFGEMVGDKDLPF